MQGRGHRKGENRPPLPLCCQAPKVPKLLYCTNMDEFEIDTPLNLRPDLELLGIQEVDKGICEDNYENRQILRRSRLSWTPVFNINGESTSLIEVLSPEMSQAKSLSTLQDKQDILTDPNDHNSDYFTGDDLILADNVNLLVPPWVINATQTHRQLQRKKRDNPGKTYKTQFQDPPGRCRAVKADGVRCQKWHAGRTDEDGLCRTHLLSKLNPERVSSSLLRARQRIGQSAYAAASVLEEMMESAVSEPVRLKAATELLDRAGIRGGVEIDQNVSIEVRPAKELLMERLAKLAPQAIQPTSDMQSQPEEDLQGDPQVITAEIVDED